MFARLWMMIRYYGLRDDTMLLRRQRGRRHGAAYAAMILRWLRYAARLLCSV